MATFRSRFNLSSGRTVWLESLEQWLVYAGSYGGNPTREINDGILREVVEEAREEDDEDPVLIAPVQRPIEHKGRSRLGEPALLPSVVCIGRFHSHEVARDPSCDCSGLTIIWFQDEYAFPVSPEAERAIFDLDWNALAHDGCY